MLNLASFEFEGALQTVLCVYLKVAVVVQFCGKVKNVKYAKR